MRQFSDIEDTLKLVKLVSSRLGTVYSTPFTTKEEFFIVRRFDSELSPLMIWHYADLIRAVHDWVERRPELSKCVRVELPLEIGSDFVLRKHHVYIRSLDSFTWEPPWAPEPDEELEQMQRAANAALGHAQDAREQIIEGIVRRSLLEPSAKTYEDDTGFVVVEPIMTVEDVKRWAELSGPQR